MYRMYRKFFLGCAFLFPTLLKEVNASSGTFIPSRLSESIQQLCVNLQSRIRCPQTSCSGSQRLCSGHSQCNCFPTAIEVCCPTTEGTGCCVNVPIPLAIG
ncbi:hypothetical protein HNY73_005289 [Argiope bruennichi]|uniref:Uncharacterized protein n=1 Tax=Argiope bruennichi TaxID=94029 RepID=A0A8T0FGW7_ARGBR|nr:hypothetical protein HNY73_005289 [Argiope bruennichi]